MMGDRAKRTVRHSAEEEKNSSWGTVGISDPVTQVSPPPETPAAVGVTRADKRLYRP